MELSKLSKKMIQMVGAAALVFMLAGAVFYRSPAALPFALGVFIPSALNVLKIIMLDRTVKKVVNMDDPNTGKNYVRLQYLLRYLLTGLVLLAIGLIHTRTDPPVISIWGAVAGVFTMQISVIICRSMKYKDTDENTGSSGDYTDGEPGSDIDDIAESVRSNDSGSRDNGENTGNQDNSTENTKNGNNNY